jgi:hypothetical protein
MPLLRLRLLRLLLLTNLLLQLHRILLLREPLGVAVVASMERGNASTLQTATHRFVQQSKRSDA